MPTAKLLLAAQAGAVLGSSADIAIVAKHLWRRQGLWHLYTGATASTLGFIQSVFRQKTSFADRKYLCELKSIIMRLNCNPCANRSPFLENFALRQ